MTEGVDYDEDLDNIDFNNYKGIFYDDSHEKYQDEVTGAHFEYFDMCRRLKKLKGEVESKENRKQVEKNETIEKKANIVLNDENLYKSKPSRNNVKGFDNANYRTTGDNGDYKELTNAFGTFIKETTPFLNYKNSDTKPYGGSRTKTLLMGKSQESKPIGKNSNFKSGTMYNLYVSNFNYRQKHIEELLNEKFKESSSNKFIKKPGIAHKKIGSKAINKPLKSRNNISITQKQTIYNTKAKNLDKKLSQLMYQTNINNFARRKSSKYHKDSTWNSKKKTDKWGLIGGKVNYSRNGTMVKSFTKGLSGLNLTQKSKGIKAKNGYVVSLLQPSLSINYKP